MTSVPQPVPADCQGSWEGEGGRASPRLPTRRGQGSPKSGDLGLCHQGNSAWPCWDPWVVAAAEAELSSEGLPGRGRVTRPQQVPGDWPLPPARPQPPPHPTKGGGWPGPKSPGPPREDLPDVFIFAGGGGGGGERKEQSNPARRYTSSWVPAPRSTRGN